MTKTPECDKMRAVAGESQKIGSFLDWLEENGYVVCERTGRKVEPFWPTKRGPEALLAQYFDIDLTKVNDEREAMLDEFRRSVAS